MKDTERTLVASAVLDVAIVLGFYIVWHLSWQIILQADPTYKTPVACWDT